MHSWNVSFREAIEIQKKFSQLIICHGKPDKINSVAGVDIAYGKNKNLGFCSIVLLSFPDLVIQKIYKTYDKINFPYIPGLLSFREGPLFLKTYQKIKQKPDIIIFDGQGIAHPRKFGIAAHLGLFINVPTIGSAKSKLYGKYEEPSKIKGAMSYIYNEENKRIGIVLRTRKNVKPIYVSPGHLIGIDETADIIMKCVTQYRIPEPIRIANKAVSEFRNWRDK
jgi:deoxyribonuclease V